MSKSNVTIQYHDFHPSENTKLFVETVIDEIYHELPQGSTVKASFSKRDDVMKGMMQVGCYNGPFFTVAASTELHEVTSRLVAQMRRRLDKWKSKKHPHRGLKQRHESNVQADAS